MNIKLPEQIKQAQEETTKIKQALNNLAPTNRKRVFEKFGLAALGSIPWVGGFVSAAASLRTEQSVLMTDHLQTRWLEEHDVKMAKLSDTLDSIAERFNLFGETIYQRIQSDDYLSLVRKSFRAWDLADTDEKRTLVTNLITQSGCTNLCSDDVVRLFIDWLNQYHEAHFKVVREVYLNNGATRHEIWMAMHEELPKENSAEADLYKLLIRDLTTGGVIRQTRETTQDGQFLRNKTKIKKEQSPLTESAFEDSKVYVLTELGKQFVQYTMSESVS